MMLHDDYRLLVRQVDELVGVFERHPDAATRDQVCSLLAGVDLLHRDPLTRLVERLREAGAGAALEQAFGDPIVRTLFSLYDLAPLPIPDPAEGRPLGRRPSSEFRRRNVDAGAAVEPQPPEDPAGERHE